MQRRKTALVTGSIERVAALERALGASGFDVTAVHHLDSMDEVSRTFTPGLMDCYVQAPLDTSVRSGTAPDRLGDFLTDGFVARCHLAGRLNGALRADGTVVLIAGHRPPADLPDDPHARFDLLRVLADTLRVEHPEARIAVVGPGCSPTDVFAVVAGKWIEPPTSSLADAASGPELSYADWRHDLMSQYGPRDWERAVFPATEPARYLGWTNRTGLGP